MTEFNIINLLVDDHKKIADLIIKIRTKKDKDAFEQLAAALKKHFKEEETLYSTYKFKTGEIIPILQTVRREHSAILKALEDKNVNELLPTLERHKNMEERLLYPEFEKILSNKEKEEAYWHIKV